MKTTSFAALLILNLFFCAYAGKGHSPSSRIINEFALKEMKETGIPGMAVAVIRNGKLLHMGAYGIANVEWGAKVTKTTAFQIASATKLITSTLVMKYMQEGKIDIEAPVTKYLTNAPESWKDIKVKHLLSHQSGIPWPASIGGYIGTKPTSTNNPVSKEQIYKDITDSALVFKPGQKESYMNGDAFVLQMILENIGGKRIPEIFEEEIFSPLKMKNSGFDSEIRNFPAQVMKPLKNKSQLFTKGKSSPLIFKSFYNTASYCSGGLYMSIADAAKWAITLNDGNFLKRETVEKLKTKMPLNGSFTALGWIRTILNKHEAYGHSGGPGLGDILYFPENNLTIIVLSNYADMYPYMALSIARLYFPDIIKKEEPKTINRGYDKMD